MRVGNILALCAFTLLAGCATGGARYADVNVAAPKLAPDRGRIYFYRSTSFVGVAIQPDIKLNGESVGSAAPGGFFFVDRTRGNYVASSATEVESKLAFALAAGETKYVRTSISPGIIVGHMNFELVSKSVAEGELASLNQTASAALR